MFPKLFPSQKLESAPASFPNVQPDVFAADLADARAIAARTSTAALSLPNYRKENEKDPPVLERKQGRASAETTAVINDAGDEKKHGQEITITPKINDNKQFVSGPVGTTLEMVRYLACKHEAIQVGYLPLQGRNSVCFKM